MRKSFTRLLSLVMLLGFVCFSNYGVLAIPVTTLGNATKVLPEGLTALTKTTDKAMVIYSENVVASTGFFRLSNSTGLVRVIPATDSRVSFAKGDTVVIDFSADLKEYTEYSVLVDASAVKAADGTPATYGLTTEWGWKTGDYTAPTLKSVVPVAGAVVTTNTINLVMTFEDNEAVVLGTGKVALYRADGHLWDLIDVTTNGTLAASVLTLTGVRALEDNVNYQVTIDAGVVTDNGLRADAKKNVYAGLTNRATWTFSSKDFSIPGYASGYPKKGTVGTTTAAILVKANEVGTAYAYAVADGAAAPTAATIRTGASVAVTAVDTEFTINVTGLGIDATSADFDVYVIIENADVAAVDANAVKIDIKTTENTAPLFNAAAGAGVKYYKGSTLNSSATVTGNVVTPVLTVAQDIDNIMLAFNEEVKIGSGNIIIRKAADNSDYMTISSSKLVLQTDKKIVKVPVTKFENNASYYVLIPNTIILDVYNNPYQGMSSTVAWKFTTNDVVGPTFTYTPLEGAANVKKDANIVLTFNEPIHALTDATLVPPVTYNVTDAFTTGTNPFIVKVDGTEVAFAVGTLENDGKFTTYTIDPTANFTSSAVVTVEIRPRSLGDIGNNVVDPQGQGIAFVVEDYVGPVLTYTTLPTTADKSVVATFNEPVYLAGGGEINSANLWTILTVKETDASGANVPYTAVIENNKKITITPSSPWTSEKTYYVAITSSLEDIAANAFSGAGRTANFTILDNTSATVDLSSVDGKTISTTAAVTLIFKEGSAVEGRSSLYYNSLWNVYSLADMAKVIVLKEGSVSGPDVPFTVTNALADNATFGIVASLAGNKTYYVGVGASTKGADGNVNVAKFVTFTTKFEGVPTIVSLSPADNATQVDKASSFVITYNTGVQLAGYTTGDIYITDGVTPINITSGEISFSSDYKTVTINPSADLANDKAYDIVVAPGVFANKNLLTSVTAAIATDAWDFVTKDTQLVVQTLTPDNATGVAIDAKLVLTFNEKVIKNLGFIDIKSDATDALIERIDVVSSQVVLSNSDKTVTITPSAKFSYNTAYYVEVSAGVLQDAVANKTEAIFGKIAAAAVSNWTFTTANPALAIVKVTPKDGADKIAADAPIVIEFNREIASLTGEVGYIEWKNSAQQTQLFAFGSTNVTISGKTLTIMHPTKPFPADAEIFLYIPNQVIKAATDATIMNTLLNQTVFTPPFATQPISFFTGDVNPPAPTFSPVAFDSGNPVYIPVDANITITFDEDIFNADGTSITIADVTSGGLFSLLDGSMAPVNFTGSISGKTVTLDPTSNLTEFTTYTIRVNSGKIEDSKGQTIGSNIDSQFKTQDVTAPTVAFTLTGGNKLVSLSVVTVTDLNNNKFYYLNRVKSDAAAPTAAEIKAANNKVSTSGTVAAFNITSLLPSTTYQLFYVADDTKGNTSAVAVKEASTDDTVAPLLVSTTPAANAMDVNVTAGGDIVVKLTFNEKVSIGAGVITVRDYATQAVLFTLSQANLAVILTDDKSLNLTIPGFNAASAPVKMYVEIASGTITDQSLTGVNAYAGAFGMSTIVFTTEDNELPAVWVGGSTSGNINLDSHFVVTFTEPVKAGTGNLVLYKGSVAAANAVQVFTASEAVFNDRQAILNPSADLENAQVYVVGVEAGFAKDLSANANGNALNTGITFTGSMNVRPFVTLLSPAVGPIAIAKASLASIAITFNENLYLSVAGYSKSLTLLTQAELLAHISVKNSAGTALAISQIIKTGANSFTISTDPAKFADQSDYTVNVSGFQDNLGLVMADYSVKYTTSDGTPPVITFYPVYKATGMVPATNLTLTFSENFYDDAIDPNKSIFSYVDNSNVKSFVYLREVTNAGADVPFTATISGKVITIDPSEDLKSGVRYYYGMFRAVEDINGSVIPLPTEEKTFVYFNAADYTAPKLITPITATNYKPLGTGVAANSEMFVIFNEEVVVSTGFIVIRHEDGTIFQMVSGAGLSIDGTNKAKLKIAHNNFEPYTNYFVEIGASTVVDKSGNANAMFNDPTPANGWLFTTNDTYALTATVTPTGENTPRSVNLELLFNKVPIGQAGKFISVYKADGTAVIEVPATSAVINGNKAMIAVSLDANQAYYAQVEAGAFKDASNNAFAGIMNQSWMFSTVNNISPKLVAVNPFSPANNAINVEQVMTFTANFDRPIAAGSGIITIRHKTDGSIYTSVNITDASKVNITGTLLTFSLQMALEKNTSYYVLIPAGTVTNTEVTKDVYAGIDDTYEWTFSTGSDDVAPTLVSKSPNTPTNMKANEVVLVGTFSENIAAGTGKLVIYNAADDTMVEGIVITPAMVSGNKITVAPTALKVSTSYYVLVEAGAVKDLAGNNFAGLTDKTAWKFSTGDYTGPTLEVTAPVAPIKTVFTVGLKFSEAVTGVLGGITVTNGNFEIEPVLGGKEYILTVSAKEQTLVTIVLSDAIKDMSANANKFAGQTLTYTTGDFTKPQMVTWTPTDGETIANNHPTFKMTFNENVVLGAGGNLVIYKVATTTPVMTIPLTAAMISGKDVTVSYVYSATKGGLDKDTRYYVLVDATALKDNAGNAFAGVSNVSDWTFKTGSVFATDVQIVNGSLFKVYPNPFDGFVNVDNASELSKVIVTNIAGQTVKVVVKPAGTIQLNELRSGVYFISLYNMDNVIAKTAKIVKR